MKYSTRVFYTETQKAEMWDRWQAATSDRPYRRVLRECCGYLFELDFQDFDLSKLPEL